MPEEQGFFNTLSDYLPDADTFSGIGSTIAQGLGSIGQITGALGAGGPEAMLNTVNRLSEERQIALSRSWDTFQKGLDKEFTIARDTAAQEHDKEMLRLKNKAEGTTERETRINVMAGQYMADPTLLELTIAGMPVEQQASLRSLAATGNYRGVAVVMEAAKGELILDHKLTLGMAGSQALSKMTELASLGITRKTHPQLVDANAAQINDLHHAATGSFSAWQGLLNNRTELLEGSRRTLAANRQRGTGVDNLSARFTSAQYEMDKLVREWSGITARMQGAVGTPHDNPLYRHYNNIFPSTASNVSTQDGAMATLLESWKQERDDSTTAHSSSNFESLAAEGKLDELSVFGSADLSEGARESDRNAAINNLLMSPGVQATETKVNQTLSVIGHMTPAQRNAIAEFPVKNGAARFYKGYVDSGRERGLAEHVRDMFGASRDKTLDVLGGISGSEWGNLSDQLQQIVSMNPADLELKHAEAEETERIGIAADEAVNAIKPTGLLKDAVFFGFDEELLEEAVKAATVQTSTQQTPITRQVRNTSEFVPAKFYLHPKIMSGIAGAFGRSLYAYQEDWPDVFSMANYHIGAIAVKAGMSPADTDKFKGGLQTELLRLKNQIDLDGKRLMPFVPGVVFTPTPDFTPGGYPNITTPLDPKGIAGRYTSENPGERSNNLWNMWTGGAFRTVSPDGKGSFDVAKFVQRMQKQTAVVARGPYGGQAVPAGQEFDDRPPIASFEEISARFKELSPIFAKIMNSKQAWIERGLVFDEPLDRYDADFQSIAWAYENSGIAGEGQDREAFYGRGSPVSRHSYPDVYSGRDLQSQYIPFRGKWKRTGKGIYEKTKHHVNRRDVINYTRASVVSIMSNPRLYEDIDDPQDKLELAMLVNSIAGLDFENDEDLRRAFVEGDGLPLEAFTTYQPDLEGRVIAGLKQAYPSTAADQEKRSDIRGLRGDVLTQDVANMRKAARETEEQLQRRQGSVVYVDGDPTNPEEIGKKYPAFLQSPDTIAANSRQGLYMKRIASDQAKLEALQSFGNNRYIMDRMTTSLSDMVNGVGGVAPYMQKEDSANIERLVESFKAYRGGLGYPTDDTSLELPGPVQNLITSLEAIDESSDYSEAEKFLRSVETLVHSVGSMAGQSINNLKEQSLLTPEQRASVVSESRNYLLGQIEDLKIMASDNRFGNLLRDAIPNKELRRLIPMSFDDMPATELGRLKKCWMLLNAQYSYQGRK